jgi:hypothetical protein
MSEGEPESRLPENLDDLDLILGDEWPWDLPDKFKVVGSSTDIVTMVEGGLHVEGYTLDMTTDGEDGVLDFSRIKIDRGKPRGYTWSQ